MGLKVDVNLEAYPKGEMLDIGGVHFENGKSVDLTDEQESMIVTRTGKSVKEALEGMSGIKVTGTTSVKPPDVEISNTTVGQED